MLMRARWLVLILALLSQPLLADIVVNTATDENVADTTCSLREAITAVNQQQAYNGCTDNATNPTWSRITFAIPPNTGELHTISLGSALPGVTRPVFIDATTQNGSVCTPVPKLTVQIDNPAHLSTDGLVLGTGSTGSKIHGLAISGFSGNSGIVVNSDNATIGCAISGMDATGATPQPNNIGIYVLGKNATIGEASAAAWYPNIVSANTYANIDVFAADNALISGNYIGVDKTGLVPLQTGYGIEVATTTGTHIGTGFADGPPAHQRNIIGVVSNTQNASVEIDLESASDTIISGNYIGVGVDGRTVLPIVIGGGINVFDSSSTLIGCNGVGTWDDCRNLLVNPSNGNFLADAVSVGGGSTNTAIVSNFVNVAADGVTSLAGTSSTQNESLDLANDTLVARNLIRAGTGIDILLEQSAVLLNPALAGSGGAPLNSTDNCLADTTSIGVTTVTSTLAFDNWWGAPNGPRPNGSGASAAAVVYSTPFLTAPSVYCSFDLIFADGFGG